MRLSVQHTNGGDCSDYLSKFQFVQDSGLSSSIQAHHQNSHLFFSKEILKEACKHVPHDGWSAEKEKRKFSYTAINM